MTSVPDIWYFAPLDARRRTCFAVIGSSPRHPLRYRAHYSGDPQDVARGHGELEVLVDTPQSSEHRLPDAAHRLAPAEMFLDALSDRLAQSIAWVSGGARVNRAAATAGVIARHMRGDVALATTRDEVPRVVGLVCTDALGAGAGYRVQHRKGRRALGLAVGVGHHRADHEPRAVLHQHVTLVAQDGSGVVALSEQTRLRVTRALMRVVAARLALPVGLGIAPRARGG